MKKGILMLLMTMAAAMAAMAQVGKWKMYLSYDEITEIQEAGNQVYVLASSDLFSFNRNDGSVQTYDKVNGLTESDIAQICYNKKTKKLCILYKNNNIDLLDAKGNVTNMPEYMQKAMSLDKTINRLTSDKENVWIATNFGIIRLNMEKEEFAETCFLGYEVNYVKIEGQNIIAASHKAGMNEAPASSNILDKKNWRRTGDFIAWTNPIDDKLKEEAIKMRPKGPKYNYFGYMTFKHNRLYTCGGQAPPYRMGCIQIMEDGKWTNIVDDGFSKTTGVKFINSNCLDVDPGDPEHIFLGANSGLYEFKNNKLINFYNNQNSPITSAYTPVNKDYEIVSAVKFDKKGHLWCFNSLGEKHALLEYDQQKWTTHDFKQLMTFKGGRAIARGQDIMFDDLGQMWFINNNWTLPSVYRYASNNIDVFKEIINQDGKSITVNNIKSITKDLAGNLWIATNFGPFMIARKDLNSKVFPFIQVKVPRNDGTNYADYLLDGKDINHIAVDGAGRKWFATTGDGAYLISSDNMKQLEHFTTSNSKLISNDIESIAINPKTGEVFFATDLGLCSYMADATEARQTIEKDNVWAYPNPVEPGYDGLITIVGLTLDADVKIVTSSGALIVEGRSNGGSFTWDGKDASGKRVASGIYMVMAATAEGNKGAVCKIAIIN